VVGGNGHLYANVVSKRRSAPYRSGACRDWRKVKTTAWREANRERWQLFETPSEAGRLFLISRDRSRCWDTLFLALPISSFFDDRGSLRETRSPYRVWGSFRFFGCAVKPGSK
jgi:hypothetical protein